MRCNREGCGKGEIDENNFCTECGRHPLAGPVASPRPAIPAVPAASADEPSRTAALAALGVERVRPEPWWGLELARSGEVPAAPEAPPEDEGPLDEEQRYCAECGRAVGRGHNGMPGRISGYCPKCTTPFDFSRPPTGQTFLGRYEYIRKIGAGGQGTTYLVRDRNLGAEVVLKALRSSVARTALIERDALVGLRHDSIVRILNYEPDGPYLVLEHVPGIELAASTADPLDVVLAHGLQILQALDYLHARNLLHCDVKPSNIVRFEDVTAGRRDRVRLIDFGAVRSFDDNSPVSVYSHGYAPPMRHPRTKRLDPEHLRPTVKFDLFCLGKTLRELSAPHVNGSPGARGVDSLRLLIGRATDLDAPARRFVSARQFAEQLSGVIRQIVADPALAGPRRVTRPSALFGEVHGALDGGLGAPRPIEHWVTAKVSADDALELPPPFASPATSAVLSTLLVPPTDPDGDLSPASLKVLAECRNALRDGAQQKAQEARKALRQADLPTWHWLRLWCSGLIALCLGEVSEATQEFTAVREMLPGELVPMLALGLCAELDEDLPTARLHYETVADTAPALGPAGFGLARVHLLEGRRAQAVRAAERLATASEFRLAPGPDIAVVRLLVALPDSNLCAPPSTADLELALDRLRELAVDDKKRIALEAEIEFARYALRGGGTAFSETVRRLGDAATTRSEFVAVVDLANRLRPPVRWGISGLPGLRRSQKARAVSP